MQSCAGSSCMEFSAHFVTLPVCMLANHIEGKQRGCCESLAEDTGANLNTMELFRRYEVEETSHA